MTEVGAYEAKTHLPRLLDRVAKGERITITKHGVPVAVLVPADGARARPLVETVAALREFRRGRRLDGLRLKDMIVEGRR
jgi:prevent-host-death family protein